MKSQKARARVVAEALEITKNTSIAPSPYELELLKKYVCGALTIDEVIELLEEKERTKAE